MSRRSPLKIALALLVAVPALAARLAGVEPGPYASAAVFGAAIVASAFLLAWAAEAAQVDISASLATALLALIAVLPEYAVDLYFAWSSGHRPEMAAFAAANMTGSNRLLIGFGWPLAVLVCAAGMRRRGEPWADVQMEPRSRVELAVLAIASVFAFVIPLSHEISLVDSAVLLGFFAAYMWRVSREERHEPDLVGVAAQIATLARGRRRLVVTGLFAAAGAFILASAQPFADALVASGARLGVDEFLLVQWLAPLASEAPELLVAALLAWRGSAGAAIGMLLSSKVNQWTLLVGSLPVAHLIGGGAGGLPLDARQVEEFYLTAAQTVLGFAVLANLRFSRPEAAALLGMFLLQFAFPGTEVRLVFSAAYLVLAAAILLRNRRSLPALARALWPPARGHSPAGSGGEPP
jgi:cation:H+ antiporter